MAEEPLTLLDQFDPQYTLEINDMSCKVYPQEKAKNFLLSHDWGCSRMIVRGTDERLYMMVRADRKRPWRIPIIYMKLLEGSNVTKSHYRSVKNESNNIPKPQNIPEIQEDPSFTPNVTLWTGGDGGKYRNHRDRINEKYRRATHKLDKTLELVTYEWMGEYLNNNKWCDGRTESLFGGFFRRDKAPAEYYRYKEFMTGVRSQDIEDHYEKYAGLQGTYIIQSNKDMYELIKLALNGVGGDHNSGKRNAQVDTKEDVIFEIEEYKEEYKNVTIVFPADMNVTLDVMHDAYAAAVKATSEFYQSPRFIQKAPAMKKYLIEKSREYKEFRDTQKAMQSRLQSEMKNAIARGDFNTANARKNELRNGPYDDFVLNNAERNIKEGRTTYEQKEKAKAEKATAPIPVFEEIPNPFGNEHNVEPNWSSVVTRPRSDIKRSQSPPLVRSGGKRRTRRKNSRRRTRQRKLRIQ